MSSNIKHKYKVDFERACSLCIVKYQELRRDRMEFQMLVLNQFHDAMLLPSGCYFKILHGTLVAYNPLLMTGAGVGSVFKVVF